MTMYDVLWSLILIIRKYIEDRDAMVPCVLPLSFEREHFATRHFSSPVFTLLI